MKNEVIIFRNSKKFLNEGKGVCKGILYCCSEYTKKNYCSCGTCTEICGPDKGCACPDCEFTLSFLLYSSGKMLCEKCNKTLIRINIYNLKNLLKTNNNPNPTFKCNVCYKNFANELYIPLMHCLKCNYDMCPSCAFEKLNSLNEKEWKDICIEGMLTSFKAGTGKGLGNIYCNNNYVEKLFCLCGKCDGNCGPTNGCPCPKCDAILGYNIYLKGNNVKCDKCGNLLIKTKVDLIKKNPKYGKTSLKCFLCSTENSDKDYNNIYFCYKCKHNACQSCIYKKSKINIKNIILPKIPLYYIESEIRKKIKKEKISHFKICKECIFSFKKKKEGGKDICIYLKTLIGTIFTININDSDYVRTIMEKLRKLDKNYKEYNSILYYDKHILDYNNFISDYEIGNENVINIMLKK